MLISDVRLLSRSCECKIIQRLETSSCLGAVFFLRLTLIQNNTCEITVPRRYTKPVNSVICIMKLSLVHSPRIRITVAQLKLTVNQKQIQVPLAVSHEPMSSNNAAQQKNRNGCYICSDPNHKQSTCPFKTKHVQNSAHKLHNTLNF